MSREGFSQGQLYLSLSSPAGKDVLLLHAFHGEEHLSAPFLLTVELRSSNAEVDFSQLVGKGAAITLNLTDGTQRYLHGIITRFVQAGTLQDFTTYYAELRPWLWLLTLTRDSRIFQNMTVPEILEKVFKDLGLTDYKLSLKGTYTAREYCVQYQESAFDFVSRLMEDEGIFYFFEHTDSKHTLVLADDASAHATTPGLTEAQVGLSTPAVMPEDLIESCTLEQQVTSNAYQMADFNFETPATKLKSLVSGSTPKLQMYEYPGGFTKQDAGDARVKLRLEARKQSAKSLRGQGRVRALIPGFKFKVAGHERADVNGDYVVRWLSHSATIERYSNSFEAFPADVTFRSPVTTSRPRISGAQTAIVVGKSSEEIWTDKYGRVKVQFHWDQEGKKDENSSCWIRVAQGWAGKSWGSLFLPRLGQEVLVTFLEGDPDQPLITGAIYNGEQTIPYTLPDEATKSTVKSNSSKGGEGFNEIRFEDKKDSEEVYIHAQKDMTLEVGNDRVTTIKNQRTTTIQEADDTLVVEKGKRVIQVKEGDETHEVKGKRDVKVTGDETHTNEANFEQKVTSNYTLKVSGDLTIDVTGSVTFKAGQGITIKAGTELTSQAGTELTNKAGTELTNQAGTNLTNKASMELTNQAGTNLTNKAGVSLTNKASVSMTNDGGVSLENKASATQTVDGGGMLTIKGGLVKIN